MADAKKKDPSVKVKVGGKVSDGKGGYYAKGENFDPKGCDVDALRERGLIE